MGLLSGPLVEYYEHLARWAEHFKELLNRPPPDVTPKINRADEKLKLNLNLPSKTEIKQAIKKLKTAKASSPDNIPPEALKANPYLTANINFSFSSALLIFGVTSGGGLFSNSLKCSAHLARCSSVVVMTFPYLSW
jgi:hypothetical protein